MARLAQGQTGDRFSRSFHEDFVNQLEALLKLAEASPDDDATTALNKKKLRDMVHKSVEEALRKLREQQ